MITEVMYLSPFTRKLRYYLFGRSSDLFRFYRLPVPVNQDSGRGDKTFLELTATGIVPDFHRIPF